MAPMVLQKAKDGEAYPYTIVSRRRDDYGMPINDRHVLWESAQTESAAMVYADRRTKEGRWVEVFKNIAHTVGA